MGKSAFSSASAQANHRPPFLRGVRPQFTDHTGSLGDVNCGSAHPYAQLSELGPQHPHPTVLQLQRVFQLFEARLQDRALPALSHRASGLL